MKQLLFDLQEMFLQRRKFITIFLAALFVLCIIGMIVSIFVDLPMAQSLNDPDQWYSKLLADYGEWPAYAINVGFPVMLFVLLVKNKKYLWSVLPFVSACIFGYFFSTRRFGVSIWFSVITITLMCLLFFLVKKDALKKPVYLGILTYVISNIAYLVMLLFKYVWGRVRFYDLIWHSQQADNYTHWFIINGPNGNESFFSGHVQSAYSLAFLWFVPFIFKIKNKIVRFFLFAIPAFYTVSMIYARIVVGAHYLSDGIFAIINLTVWAIVVMKVMFRKTLRHSIA